jgi:hypothetical protein
MKGVEIVDIEVDIICIDNNDHTGQSNSMQSSLYTLFLQHSVILVSIHFMITRTVLFV